MSKTHFPTYSHAYIPAIKEARYIRWSNDKLRTNIKVMKMKIDDLKIQLRKSGGHP